MEQKRKIIIPVGGSREAIPARDFDGAATAQAPLFDAEATLGARPVVPLAETQRSRHFPLLALVVILAISAGVAGGFAIGLYKSRQTQESAAPNTTATINTDATTAQAPAQQLPAAIASEKTPEPERTTASNAPTERTARDNKPKRDEEQVIPPVEVRERGKEKRDREDRDREDKIAKDDERELKRQQRRERRRRARENDEANGDVNQ